jgi:hypothetical protein
VRPAAAGEADAAGTDADPGPLRGPGPSAGATLTPAAATWLLLPFFAWQFFHFAKQNLGMTALAARTAGAPPLRAAERRVFFSVPVFVFASPYAAVGGMTIAHGMQYLLLVSLVAAGGPGQAGRALRLAVLCNVALLGGAVLAVTSHLHSGGPALRLLFGAYLGAVMAHFVVDAGLWRLRDPLARAFLARRLPYLMGATPAARSGGDIR